MSVNVVLPFSTCASSSSNGSVKVHVNPDILDWLADNAPPISQKVNWMLGRDYSRWQVMFNLPDKHTAVLFKLTFGGR